MLKKQKKRLQLHPNTVHLLKQIGIGIGVLSLCAGIFTSVWHVTRLPAFSIQSVVAEGGITIRPDAVSASALSALGGEYWRFIPRRFSFLYPEADIYNEVSKIERIKNVQIERVSPKELLISYEEYIPDSLWCKLTEKESCLFLDETGFAFASAPKLSGEAMLRYFSSEVDPALGTSSFSEIDYRKSKELVVALSNIGWYVSQVEINSVGDVFLFVSDRGELKITLSEDVAQVLNNLTTILNSEEFKHLQEEKFNYIDLRFGNRVFVNEAKPEDQATASSTATGTPTTSTTE